jgi:hypothetical protein
MRKWSASKKVVQRDVEYANKECVLRLLEQQERMMQLARDVSNRQISDVVNFA